METRRLMNDAMPRQLFWAQLGLYTWAFFGIARGAILTGLGDMPASALFLTLVMGFVRAMAAYGISNEGRWGYWLGLVACAVTIMPTLDDLVHQPSLLFHPDFVLLLILPVMVVLCLLNPASRDFQKMWFK